MDSKTLSFSLVVSLLFCSTSAQLSLDFYSRTCPKLEDIVRQTVSEAVGKDPRAAASILRLFFHDCFVQGCDGSVLLDDTLFFKGEKNAIPNRNSLRGYEVIDAIKARMEAACKGVVSCADIVALAARDSVALSGGPSWRVLLGRRDSRRASRSAATLNIPAPAFNLPALITSFSAKGLTPRDLTALSGAHTIGFARCTNFRSHIYFDRNINPFFAAVRRATCPLVSGDDNLAPLSIETPTTFDNSYFVQLRAEKGLLHSDQELFNGGTQDELVRLYSEDRDAFFRDFVKAMVKMGNITPLTGTRGEIRRNCRVVN